MGQTTTDVLIIGSGPTGTTLALELAAQGIPFRIVDKIGQRSDKSKALAVQPRSLELMGRHGPVERLVERGNLGLGGTIFVNGKKAADLDLGGVRATRDSAFPHTVLTPQSETEGFLANCLATRYGRAVEFGTEATSVVQDAGGVTVTLRKVTSPVSSPPSSSASSTRGDGGRDGDSEAHETETVRAKYVVGADGAHSVVRHAAAVAFEGDAYPQDFILCDAHIRNTAMPRNRFRICMRYGLLLVFPLGNDIVRLVASRPGVTATEEPALGDFQEWLEYMVPDGSAGELFDPIWMTRFKLHHRVSTNYRDRRFLLAGDAAHIHSPAGGQGMNTGSRYLTISPIWSSPINSSMESLTSHPCCSSTANFLISPRLGQPGLEARARPSGRAAGRLPRLIQRGAPARRLADPGLVRLAVQPDGLAELAVAFLPQPAGSLGPALPPGRRDAPQPRVPLRVPARHPLPPQLYCRDR